MILVIIDFHTHCFPDKIAEKAIEILRKRSGITRPFHNGTVNGLLALQKGDGVDYSVVLNIATNPHQQESVNNFAIFLKNVDGIIPFGSVHPDSPDALNELERLAANGIKGVKLHPDYQGFFVNDEKLFPIYEKIASLGMITLFHCGFDIGYPEPVHCTAEALASVLDNLLYVSIVIRGERFVAGSEVEYFAVASVVADTASEYFTA